MTPRGKRQLSIGMDQTLHGALIGPSSVDRYNGRVTDPPPQFPKEMEDACQFIEKVVNDEIRKRPRFRLEWDGGAEGNPTWRANVAASNCYRGGKESVGFHSDQLTYLGPYPTIASLSLGKLTPYKFTVFTKSTFIIGTRRNFNLREVIPADKTGLRRSRTFNIPLPHNSVC